MRTLGRWGALGAMVAPVVGCKVPEPEPSTAKAPSAAPFIKWNMPQGLEGTLSDDEAYDIAAFVLSHLRPDYPAKVHDWPNGGKPADAPY